MIIQLVSFPKYQRLTAAECTNRMDIISMILTSSNADFIMFSEHVLKSEDDLYALLKFRKYNKNITALFELKESNGLSGNRLYLLQNGFIRELSHQLISTANEVNEDTVDALLKEFKRRRQFDVNGKRFLIVQCGENNILKGTAGCAEFRLKDTQPEQHSQFEKLLNNVDIVLNPVHTRWGRFSNFLTRIRKFSDNNRYCFSCTQMEGNQLQSARENPTHNTTHVAMYNQELITPVYTNENENYLIQSYEIE